MDAIQPTVQDSMPATQAPKKRSIIKTILLVVGGIIVFGAAIFALAFFMTADIAKTGEIFIRNLSTGHIEEAYNESSTSFKEVGSVDKFKSFLKEYPILTQKNSVSFSSRSFHNDSGRLYGTIKDSKGNTLPIKISLVKEKGVWRVSGFQLNPVGNYTIR